MDRSPPTLPPSRPLALLLTAVLAACVPIVPEALDAGSSPEQPCSPTDTHLADAVIAYDDAVDDIESLGRLDDMNDLSWVMSHLADAIKALPHEHGTTLLDRSADEITAATLWMRGVPIDFSRHVTNQALATASTALTSAARGRYRRVEGARTGAAELQRIVRTLGHRSRLYRRDDDILAALHAAQRALDAMAAGCGE